MARPSPHPATSPASHVIQSHFARIREPPLIDRERRRHRDAALVRQRVGVRPEAEVEAHAPEPYPAAPAELDPFALVARDTAAQRHNADALLPADVHDGAAAGVQYIRPERR